MNKLIKEFKRDYIILSMVYLILGGLLLFVPETSGTLMCYIVAAIAAFFGVTHLIAYGAQKYPYETYRFDLVFGMVGIAAGAYVFFKPEILISVMPTVLGVIVFVDGMVKLQNAIDLKRMHYAYWWIVLILTAIMSALGCLMILYPFESAMTVLMFSGICLIVNAFVDLYAIFTLTHIIKKIQQQIERGTDESNENIVRPFDVKVDDIDKRKAEIIPEVQLEMPEELAKPETDTATIEDEA